MKTNSDGIQIVTPDLLRKILVREMGLNEDRVIIYNQKFKIPTDDGLFATVGYKGTPRTISNRNTPVAATSALSEVQDINTQELLFINLYSRSMEALQRKEEMLMAINSIYAQQIQEENSFRINRVSSIEDLSELEGAGQLYRFEISLLCFAWYTKTKNADFFDAFTTELSTEQEAGMEIIP